MSLEDISTLYAEDLAVTADVENVRHPDKLYEENRKLTDENRKFTDEIRKFTEENRVLPYLMTQMLRKIDDLRDGVDGRIVVLLKIQIDRMGADLRDLRNVVAETMQKVKELTEKKRESDSMQITELVQVVKELKEEMTALRNSALPNDSRTELVQVVQELKEEMTALRNSARPYDSYYQLTLGAGTKHPPSEESDSMESIVNIISLYSKSKEDIKLTNFEEEKQTQQGSDVSKGTEQLHTDESIEDAPSKYYGDSVVTTKNTEEDNVKISTLIAETVDDAKFANSKEEMQGKLDNRGARKEQPEIKKTAEDVPAKDDGDSVVINEDTGEDYDKNISLCPDAEDDAELAKSEEEIRSRLGDERVSRVTEQLPTKKSEEDTQEKDGGDSVANTNNTKKDTVESISMCSETEEDAKLTNSQQKMQSKLVDGKVNKVTEQLPTNESVKDAPAKEDGDSVVLIEDTEEDNDKNISLFPEAEDDAELAKSEEEIRSKLDDERVSRVKEQLSNKKSEEDTQEKDGGDSVANTNNTEKDTVESSSMCLETEEDAKLTNSQQEMQSKLVDGKVNKVTEQLPTNESVKDAPAKEDGDSVVLIEDTQEDNDKNISIFPEAEYDAKLANSEEEIRSKLDDERFSRVTEQLPTKESVEDVQERNVDDSVAITNNAEEDNVKNSLICLETEENDKLANSQQEMQSKLVDGKVKKVIEQLPTNESVEDAPAKDENDTVAITYSNKEDNVKKSSICLETEEDTKLALQEMQSKLDSGEVSEVETKQLPTTESEKHAPAKDGGDSVVNTFNIKTDSVKNSSLYLETEEAAKMANFQEEMQSEVDNGEVGTKQLTGEKNVEDAPTLDDDIKNHNVEKSSSHPETEDVNFKLAIFQEEMQSELDEEVKTQQKGYTFKQTSMKQDQELEYIRKNKQTDPESSNLVSSSLDLDENERCIESWQRDTKDIDRALKQIHVELGRADEEQQTKVNDGLKSLEEHLTMGSRKKTTTAEFQEKSKDIQEPKPDSTVGVIPNAKDVMIKSLDKKIQMTNVNGTCLLEEENQEKNQVYNVPDIDANLHVSTDNDLSEKSEASCIKYKQAAPFLNIKTQGDASDEQHPISIKNVPQSKLWYTNDQNCTQMDMEMHPVTYPQELPKTVYPLDEGEMKTKELMSNCLHGESPNSFSSQGFYDSLVNEKSLNEDRKKLPQDIISDSLPNIQSINVECISEHPQRTSENVSSHDLEVGSVKNCHQLSNTVGTCKGKYELVHSISNRKQDGSPGLSNMPRPLNSEYQTIPVSNLPTIHKDLYYLRENRNSRLLRTKDFHITDDNINQRRKSQENRKSKQFRSKIPRYQGIKSKVTSPNDEDIDINKHVYHDESIYVRSNKKTQTQPNPQDYRCENDQTNQIYTGDIPMMKHNIVMVSSSKVVHTDINTKIPVVTRANYRKSKKLSDSCDDNSSQPWKDHTDINHQILTTEKQHFIRCTSRHVWNKNMGISKNQRRVSGNESEFYNKSETGPVVDKRDNAARFPNRWREMGSETEDVNLKSDYIYEKSENSNQQRRRIDLNKSDAVVPQIEDFYALRRPNYYSSGKDMIGNPIASSTPIVQRLVLEPVATSTPKDTESLAEDNSNQVVPSWSYFYDEVMKSDSAIDFDLKLKSAELFLGKTVIGEIAFQLNKRMMKIVFQQNTTKFMKDLMRDRYYGHAVQSISYLIKKETLKADGTEDVIGELIYRDRLENLLKQLEKHGYKEKIHGDFARKMVEKYGTLNCRLSRRQVNEYGLEDQDVLEALLNEIAADKSELHNTMVLLNCLRTIVIWDGGHLFTCIS